MRCLPYLATVSCIAVSFVASDAAEVSQPALKTYQIDFSTSNREWFIFLSKGIKEKRLAIAERVTMLLKEAPANDVIHLFHTGEIHTHMLSVTIPEADAALRMRKKDMKLRFHRDC